MSFTKIGKIFERINLESVAQASINETLEHGRKLIFKDSPFRSGTLREGWYTTKDSIENDVPYTVFQEEGTRYMKPRYMVKKNIPEIERFLLKKLGEDITNSLQ